MIPFTIKNKKKPPMWRNMIVFLAIIALWQWLSQRINRELLLPSPILVGQRLFMLLPTAIFWQSIARSLLSIFTGFVLGVLAGFLFAWLSYISSWFSSFIRPIMTVIRATPVASFIVLALVWITRGRVPVFMSMLMVTPQTFAFIYQAFEQTDIQLLEFAQVSRLSVWKTYRYIYFPSVLPALLSSMTTGIGLAWKAGIAAEVLSAAPSTIGVHILESKRYLETPDLFAWTIVIIFLSLLIEMLFKKLISVQKIR